MDKKIKNGDALVKFLFEKELAGIAEKNLIKINQNTYLIKVNGKKVRLVFGNLSGGISLESALAKIAIGKGRGYNG